MQAVVVQAAFGDLLRDPRIDLLSGDLRERRIRPEGREEVVVDSALVFVERRGSALLFDLEVLQPVAACPRERVDSAGS